MRRTQVETLGTCEWCPHGLVLLRSGAYWCPCEDCHAGGRIQGRTYPDTVTQVTATVTATATPKREAKPDGDVWVDPIHNI
jgi:hypothetical protein